MVSGAALVVESVADAAGAVDAAAAVAVAKNDEVAVAAVVFELVRPSATLHGCGLCRIPGIFLREEEITKANISF